MPLVPLLAAHYTPVVPLAETVAFWARHGIETVEWGTLADPARQPELQAAAHRLAAEWYDRLELAADALCSLAGEERGGEFLPAVDGVVRRLLAEHLDALSLGRALGQSGRLAAAVVHEDVTGLVRAFLAGVREAGVPAVHVPHGVYGDDALVGADLHGTSHTDVIAAGGPAQRAWFLRRGVPADRIVVTGNPAWDHLAAVVPRPAGTGGRGPVVTVAGSWVGGGNAYRAFTQHDQDRRLCACLAAVGARQAADPSVQLVVKLHPSAPASEDERVRALAEASGARLDVVAREHLVQILVASDVLMTLPSTLVVEALLVGTPVIAVDCFYETDAVLSGPADPTVLCALLGRALAGWRTSAEFAARRQEFVARYQGCADGHAGARVVALINALAARPRAARRPPTRVPPLAHRLAAARARMDAGDVDGALELLPYALVSAAAAPAAWTLRGEALARGGRGREAEECFRDALAGGPWAPAHAGLGLLFLEQGREAEAAGALADAVAVDPGCDNGWAGLGVLAALAGHAPEATRLLTRALGLNPGNVDARNALRALAARDLDDPVRTACAAETSAGATWSAGG
jgi:Flp pilus assembly protein TadD